MYYNRILRVWVMDQFDYFLLSAFIGSLVASQLKAHLSEKKTMERLKNSIIKKSKIVHQSDRPIFNSTETRIKKISKVALGYRGGAFENFHADQKALKLAGIIKRLVERLAHFLKERELKGIARIFFKNSRIVLELVLCRCNINLTYALLSEGLSTQVIVITSTVGGAAGFTLSWFSAGASLVAPPVLLATLLIRSGVQQILNQIDYVKFKKLITQILENEELKRTLKVTFMDGEAPKVPNLPIPDSDTNPLPEFNFDLQSDQTPEEFIKARMEEGLGLIENPTSEQIEQIVQRRKIRPKAKTVYFRDFINEIPEDPGDIIDAEIVKEPLRVKAKNDEL